MRSQATALSQDNARTIQPSLESDSAAAGAKIIQFISFAIGDDHYGVDIMAVREIKEWSEITYLY